MILTRKIQLFPVGDKEEIDRVYKYLRDGIFNQNKAMNLQSYYYQYQRIHEDQTT